jgi:tRNA A-37 threonylcarbamoyl transferase component Bud32
VSGEATNGNNPLRHLPSQAWDQVQSAVRKFEAAWHEGATPNPRDYLDSAPPEIRRAMLVEMIHADFEFRLKAGQDPQVETYLAEYPEIREDPACLRDLLEAGAAAKSDHASDLAGFSTIDGGSQESRSGFQDATEDSRNASSGRSHPRVPGYEILEELGRGGMGVVYKARQEKLGRVVALKMIGTSLGVDAKARTRFRTEAEAAASLQSPFVVQVFEIGECDDQPFLALEYCDGGSLAEASKAGPIALSDALRWTLQIAEGVAAAHRQRVIHRDLKPANILFASNGQVKVSDFGLAKKLDEPGLTRTGEVMGTPNFMAPEQANGELNKIGPATDVYGIGAILYQMLTGSPPFKADSSIEVLDRVRNQEPIPPSRLRPRLPRDLETICLKCLNKEPAGRYGSARELAEDVKRFEAGDPILGRRNGFAARLVRTIRRRPGMSAALGLLILAAATSVSFAVVAVRNGRIVELTGAIESELHGPEPTEAQVRHVESLIADLRTLDASKGTDANRRLDERLAEHVRILLRERLTPAQKDRIEAALRLLAPRDPKRHDELKTAYGQRLSDWETTFELAAPFAELRTVFDATRDGIESDGVCLVRRGGKGDETFVSGKSRFSNGSKLSAEFDPSWAQAALAELSLQHSAGNAYVFRMWVVGEAAKPFVPSTPAARSFADSMKKGQQTIFAVWRSRASAYLPIAVRRLSAEQLAAHCPAGAPLRLEIARDGDCLSFQINDLPSLVFHDLFPIPESTSEGFGVFWPSGLRLSRLKGYTRSEPAVPSPLEDGDRLVNQDRLASALAVYEGLSVRAESSAMRREALYKAGICRLGLHRETEAKGDFERLAAGAVDGSGVMQLDSWTWLANSQLLLARLGSRDANERARADEILDRLALMKVDRGNDLAVRVPFPEVQTLAQSYSQRGLSLFTKRTSDFVKASERADAFADLYLADFFVRTQCKHMLVRAYRMAGKSESARTIANNWLQSAHEGGDQGSADEFGRVMLEEHGWIAREGKIATEIQAALALHDRWLYSADTLIRKDSYRSAYPLLVERARLLAALGKRAEAEKALAEFFRCCESDPESTGYSTFAEACLLLGFLQEAAGDGKSAQQSWTRGLWSNWRYGKEGAPLNVETAGGAGLLCHSILSGLTEQSTDSSIDAGIAALFATGGSSQGHQSGTASRVLEMMKVPPQTLRQSWRTPRAREWARRIALKDLTLAEYVRMPIFLFGTEYLRHAIGAEPSSTDHEQMIWDWVNVSYDAYQANKVREHQLLIYVSVWQGVDLPGFGWANLAPELDPAIRGPLAYFLGRKQASANRTDAALRFFRSARDDAPADSPLRRLAQAEIDRLSAK